MTCKHTQLLNIAKGIAIFHVNNSAFNKNVKSQPQHNTSSHKNICHNRESNPVALVPLSEALPLGNRNNLKYRLK